MGLWLGVREEPGFGLARAQFSVWYLVGEPQGLCAQVAPPPS